MNTSILMRRVLPVAILAVLVGGALYWTTLAKPVAVVLKTVDRGIVESTVVNTRAGTVDACQRTKLSTILGGRIVVMAVKEGDHVKKGQLLMKLWNDDQKAQQRLAEAGLASTRQHLNEICAAASRATRVCVRSKSSMSIVRSSIPIGRRPCAGSIPRASPRARSATRARAR